MKKQSNTKIQWYGLAFMAFSTVWGFGNVINGFSEYNGLQVIVSWILIFAIYFVPYSLMVGELGSAFKTAGGGASSWIHETIGPRMAYYAGWTFWVVHIPYISQRPNSCIIATSWVLFQDNRASQMNTTVIQLIGLVIFIVAILLASRGLSVIKKLSTLAGTTMFIMSILYIILMLAAPAITNAPLLKIDWSLKTFIPTFDAKFFTGLSILVFAVGGCEKISPYVNKMKDPARGFSKGMIALSIMVAITAILGTISLGMMFDSNNIPSDLMTNGAYYAFQRLGEYYGIGNFLVVVYALVTLLGQFAVMVLCIDAPLRMLLNSANEQFIPKILFKQNKYGAYTNGNKLIAIFGSLLIIIPAFGIKNVDVLVRCMVKLNSVCLPLCHFWVFVAYIFLKKSIEKFPAEYRFVKSKTLGMVLGGWCFFLTAIACIGGSYSEDPFQLILNILTPFLLIGLGLIMPYFAKREKLKIGS